MTPETTPIPEPKKLKLSKAQAIAVRATITEINQLSGVIHQKHQEFKRLTDMIESDAELEPDAYLIDGVEDVKGEAFLKLVAKPKPEGA